MDNIRIETNDLTNIYNQTNESTLIYPNPAVNKINVTGIKNGDQYEIFNVNGLLIKSEIYNEHIKLDFPSGLYFFKTGTIVDKFIIR